MEACKLIINDQYLYTGVVITQGVVYTGFDRNGYVFHCIATGAKRRK